MKRMNPVIHTIAQASEGRLLTADEEVTLGQLARAGDTDARDLLVERNTRLAWSVAHWHRDRGLELEDVYQEALIGLLRAIDDWNPDRGMRFSTYATWWVRRFAQRGIENAAGIVRLPVHMHQRVRQLRYAESELTPILNRKPTLSELATHLGWSLVQVQTTHGARASTAAQSLEAPLREGDPDSIAFGDRLACAVAEEAYGIAEERLDTARARAQILAALATLTEREALVVQRYYGFGADNQPQTYQQIGNALGVTREYIRQVHNVALHKIAPLLDPEMLAVAVPGDTDWWMDAA